MALIYNATFDKNTRKLSFEDKAGNEIYSFIVPERAPVDYITKPLTFKATQDGSTVKLTKYNFPSGSFQTSRDGGNTWTDYTIDTAIALNTGDEVAFRAKSDRTSAQDANNHFQFKMTGKIEAWHNVMSMYRKDDFATYNTDMAYSFTRLFNGCASLTKAPALPATTLADYCYNGMFTGCTSLTKAPELPATTLVQYCYSYMFSGCTSLVNAPVLPATTLAQYCYRNMFSGCTSLTEAPALPATTLAYCCYYSMFSGCTALAEAPALPVTTLATSCYKYMFYGCTSLTKAPALPATTLIDSCYDSMFNGCTSLTEAPELSATTLANYCYNGMFKGCSSLNEVRCKMPSSYSSSDIPTYTDTWLSNVSSTGTFYTNADANWSSGASGIPEGWNRVNEEAPAVDDLTKPLTFRATQDGSTVTLTWTISPIDCQTSRDGGNTWEDYTLVHAITLNTGEEVSFRAKNNRSSKQSSDDYFYFEMTGKIEAWHNVMSMYRKIDFATFNAVVSYAFNRVFEGCTSLTKAPALPATKLANNCYQHMFYGCTSLTEAPELPATTISPYCYDNMFYGCTSLTKAPELPATTISSYCYSSMFYGCTSLTKAPELPATTISSYCYNSMFSGCTSLVNAPVLPATTLAQNCYSSMFNGCNSLVKAPALPATKLANNCYQHMFYGCTSLTEAPALPATTLGVKCYDNMFRGCTSLTEAPALPATKLTTFCYRTMFGDCRSLTTAPALPATTLADYCYQYMFYGCSSLNEVRCQMPSSYSSSQISSVYAENWLLNVASTGTFHTNADANWSSGSVSGIPEGWTRVNA